VRWGQDLWTLATTVTGGVIAIFATFFAVRQEAKRRRRESAANRVGLALAALRDLSPLVYGRRLLLDEERRRARMAEKRARWQIAADGLAGLAAANPDSKISRLCEDALDHGGVVLIRLAELTGLAAPPPDAVWDESVNASYEAALGALWELARAIM
jgi:hypothetical protein